MLILSIAIFHNRKCFLIVNGDRWLLISLSAFSSFQSLLKKKINQQIKQLSIRSRYRKGLEIIRKRLLNLEEFEIISDLGGEFDYDEIIYENVRKLRVSRNAACYDKVK